MWFYSFPNALVFRVTGKDALRYTHNRLSTDVRSLPERGGRVGAALSPQGKVLALFTVFKVSETEMLLVADGGDAEKVREGFCRFLVADKVHVENQSSKWAWAHCSGLTEFPEKLKFFIHPTKRTAQDGLDILIEKERSAELISFFAESKILAVSDDRYKLERVKAGFVSFPEELNESMILTESGRSDALIFGKGCYVGQEVIEKIDAFGKLPKTCVRLSGSGDLSSPEGEALLLKSDEEAVGKIISAAYDRSDNTTWIIGSVKTKVAKQGTIVKCRGFDLTIM